MQNYKFCRLCYLWVWCLFVIGFNSSMCCNVIFERYCWQRSFSLSGWWLSNFSPYTNWVMQLLYFLFLYIVFYVYRYLFPCIMTLRQTSNKETRRFCICNYRQIIIIIKTKITIPLILQLPLLLLIMITTVRMLTILLWKERISLWSLQSYSDQVSGKETYTADFAIWITDN